MNRATQIEQLKTIIEWDFIIIGGGATGLGTALDATSRGYKTVLFEAIDFAKGTSSRSTKLLHGGVRYLAQGNIDLVSEALKERDLLAQNAQHLFVNQIFVIPNYSWWRGIFYYTGLKIYDFLAGKKNLGKSKIISKKQTIDLLPTVLQRNLKCGIMYHDGQFDDARLAVNLAQTATNKGACILNYFKVIELLFDKKNKLEGVLVKDQENSNQYQIKAKVIINATGVFINEILALNKDKKSNLVVPSQGVHLVLDASFLNSDHAVMIPKTSDGRVLFIVPWHNKIILGTTDTLIEKPNIEPKALESEIDFILNTAQQYLTKKPTRADVLSVFAGLRPLATPEKEGQSTKEVSRSHKIIVSPTGLITLTGGKWTTYRKIAQDIVDTAIRKKRLPKRQCITENLAIQGNIKTNENDRNNHLYIYGSDKEKIIHLIEKNPEWQEKLHPNYNYTLAEVVWSIRFEMARTIEDVLARRVRLLFLDASAAIDASEKVAFLLAKELNKDKNWEMQQIKTFKTLAKNYFLK